MGARCSAELLREQVGQVNVLPSKDCVDQFFREGRILLITYAGSWEVGWGGLQVAEVREAVEEGVVVVGARYGRGMRGRGRGRLNMGALPAALKVGR